MSEIAQKVIKAIVSRGREENYERLLPIKQAYLGSSFQDSWTYEPHKDYLEYKWDEWKKMSKEQGVELGESDYEQFKKSDSFETHTIEYKKFNELGIIRNMEEEIGNSSYLVEKYNEFVDEKNAIFERELFEKSKIDTDGAWIDVDYSDIEAKQYKRHSYPPLWELEVQTQSPKYRSLIDDYELGIYGFEDEALFKALHYLVTTDLKDEKEHYKDEWIKMFNLMLYDHIQLAREVAEDGSVWDESNIYWLPNKEFVRYFQENGINPKTARRFENCEIHFPHHILNTFEPISSLFISGVKYDSRYRESIMDKIFDGQTEYHEEENNSYKELAWECLKIYEDNKHHFNSIRDVYREASERWTLKGERYPADGKILWRQLENNKGKY